MESSGDDRIALAQVHAGHVLTGIAFVCIAAVLCSMFYAASTPSAPKPPPTIGQLLSQSIDDKTGAVNSCITSAYNQHRSDSLTPKDHADIIAACSTAIAAVTQQAQNGLQTLQEHAVSQQHDPCE